MLFRSLLERATDAESSILADDAAADGLARAARVLETAAEVDPAVSQLAERARKVAALAADLGMDVRGYRESLGLDPGRLDVVRERIAALRGLLRKYGGTEEELLAFLDGARGDLESLAGAGDRAAALTAEIARLETRVAEAAAVGRPDELKGQALVVFVTLKAGQQASDTLKEELRAHVAKEIGSLARPDAVRFAAGLPKTRSGKIMRRILKDLAAGAEVKGDTSTLEDFSVVAALQSDE